MTEHSAPVPADVVSAAGEPGVAPPADTGGLPDTASPRDEDSFPSSGSGLGWRVLLLIACRFLTERAPRNLILLAFEDVTGTARQAAP